MELKQRILDAVLEEYNEKGIHFTMDDLAKRIGISKRTLYTVVREKEALLQEVLQNAFLDIKSAKMQILEDDSMDIREKLRKLLIVIPQKYQALDFTKLNDAKDKYPEIYHSLEIHLESEWDSIFAFMQEAMEQGIIRNISLPVFQAVFTGTIEFFLSRNVLSEHQIQYTEGLEQMMDILLNGIETKSNIK